RMAPAGAWPAGPWSGTAAARRPRGSSSGSASGARTPGTPPAYSAPPSARGDGSPPTPPCRRTLPPPGARRPITGVIVTVGQQALGALHFSIGGPYLGRRRTSRSAFTPHGSVASQHTPVVAGFVCRSSSNMSVLLHRKRV